MPLDGRSRPLLLRHQHPLVGLGQARRDGRIGGLLLRLGLPHLEPAEVERVLLGEDRRPREDLAQRLVQVLQPHLVGGQEHERVACG